jgi:hypothetical protein
MRYWHGMTPTYVTVYQIPTPYPNWLFTCAEFAPLVLAGLFLIAKRRFRWQRIRWFHCVFICVFAFIVSSLVPSADINSEVFNLYRSGWYSQVEGTVTDFHPMPYEGHEDECFSVQAQRFCYSDYIIVPGFHNSASHGSPIRSGLPVRIAYSGQTILRIDIPSDQVLAPDALRASSDIAQKQANARMEGDPLIQRMNTAFFFTAFGLTLWWNLRWKQVMRFWVRPPNRPMTQYVFRIFFAANFLGVCIQLVHQLRQHPLTKATVGPIFVTTIAMVVVVSLMSFLVLRSAERRDRQRTGIGAHPSSTES